MRVAVLLVMAASAWAQIESPQIGVVLLGDGVARPLHGVSGSLTIGDPVASGVISMGCGAQFCLMKMVSTIVSPAGIVDAPAGPAMFWFANDSALVYFSQTKQLMRWRGAALEEIAINIAGEVLSIRQAADGSIQLATRVRGAVWFMGPNDELLHSIVGATGPALLLDNGVLFATRGGIVLRRDDATEVRFAIEHVESLSWLGANHVQVHSGRSNWAIRVEAGHERMFLLPESR